MKDSAKIWYSIRRGTLRIVLAAFAACAAATVPANVVRNDLVTATSDAELETSDKGMGLGINVVGGGDAVITLETRPGWTFRDGSTTYTMKKLAGVDARSPEIVNEGSTVESGGEIPAGETEKEKPEEEKPEEKEPEEGGVEHVPPEVSISVKSVPTAAAYALPANSATVAFELSASVKSDAEHRETDKNGNKTKGPETFSPDEYVWKAVASNTVTAVCVEWGASLSDKSATGALQLGKGTWKVAFSVYAKATCPICNATVESAEDDEVRTVTVYEVSINRPDYLGLDQTDAGRKGHTVKEATLVTDPKCEGLKDDAVTWTACGKLCEFKDENGVAKSKGEKVKYRNKGPDKASGAIRAEPLTAKVSIPGAEDVYCTTNFTVVKVDVKIGDMDENREEAKGRAVMFSKPDRDRASGELIWSTVKSYPVKFVVKPDSLPGGELFRLESNDFPGRAKMLRCGTKNAEEGYKLSELRSNSFSIVLPYRSTEWNDRWVMLTHLNSGARDKACMTCCDIELVSPSGDPVSAPGETNEFTYDDESKTLTVPFRAQIVPKPKVSVSGLTGTFTAGDIPGVACTWKTPSGGKIGDGLSASVEIESDWSFRASAVFDGYPEHNDSFGRKKAKFELKSKHKSYALENDYEVFFPKKGKNHPECKNCPGCPNWFYYWKEGQACKIPDNAYYAGAKEKTYGATSISMLMAAEKAEKLGFAEAGKVLDLNHVIAIYDLAAEEEQEFKIPTPNWAKWNEKYAKKYAGFTVGGLRGGLACCAAIVAHEMHHVDMWKEFHGKPDRDKDGVADESEEKYDGIATRVDKCDTYNVSGEIDSSYIDEGDNEVRARIVERTGPSYDAAKDWANPGFQCKDHSESYDKVKEYGK